MLRGWSQVSGDARLWKKLMRSGDGSFRRFEELGLENTREMFEKASRGNYAIPGYNFYNLEQLRGIVYGCVETKSPAILQILRPHIDDRSLNYLLSMVRGVIGSIAEKEHKIPLALNLDHGNSFELCKKCVDFGFSSVMIDGSSLPYEGNSQLTKRVVDYAHEHDVSVEAELGGIGGIEERMTAEHMFTKPKQVEDFIKRTGADSLALSIGTVHGPYKSRLEHEPVRLRFDILDEVKTRVGGFPLVLHGASGVPPQYVEIMNRYGGRMEGARGLDDDQLRTAIRKGIRKANFDTDIKLIFTAIARQYFADKPTEFDPKKYLDPAEEKLREYVRNKNRILSSANRA
jgi:fructose-bisphosphate aldolase class II